MNADSLVARFINEAKAAKTAVIVFYAVMKNDKPIMRMRSSSASPEAAMRFVMQVDDQAIEAAAQAMDKWLNETAPDTSPRDGRILLAPDLRNLARIALEAGRAAAGAKAADIGSH